MQRNELLEYLGKAILNLKKDSPLLIAIDGVDASGKTTLADEIAQCLQEKTRRNIIRASIDGFHNPKNIRYKKGRNSPQGFYEDSFNYKVVIDLLLEPLSNKGNRNFKVQAFDCILDTTIETPFKTANNNDILIMDGIFLQRPELQQYWDLTIFLEVDFETILQRAILRDQEKTPLSAMVNNYQQRYIPGQQLYFSLNNPKEQADIVIDNTNFHHPKIIRFLPSQE